MKAVLIISLICFFGFIHSLHLKGNSYSTGKGKEISIQELADIFIKQQENDVENINLVTPTSYVPQIIEAIKRANSVQRK